MWCEVFLEKGSFISKHLIGLKFNYRLKALLKALEDAKELFGLVLYAGHQSVRYQVCKESMLTIS